MLINIIESEEIQTIFNKLNDGIFITNNEGIVLWMNDTSTQQLNKSRSELIGQHISSLEKIGVFKPSVTKNVLKEKKVITKIQTSNNYKYLATGRLITFPNEREEYVLVQVTDITETLKSSLKLEKSGELLQKYRSLILPPSLPSSKQTNATLVKGKSPKFNDLLDIMFHVSQVDTNILLTGETGVGKSKFAEEIHNMSKRNSKPFIKINCGAIPETLLESELFGYKKGAFTGANISGKKGLVSSANGGTLFLDEISELPMTLQSKILQLVQDHTFIPIGSSKEEKVDIRIITATNRDLLHMIEQNSFRKDLYYRLNVVELNIPTLRERKQDLDELITHFLDYFNNKYDKSVVLTDELLNYLKSYNWPGNIRELENTIEYLVVIEKNGAINLSYLPKKFSENDKNHQSYIPENSLPKYLNNIEKNILKNAHSTYKSTRDAANSLGISQTTFIRKLKKYNL